jgi:hypothetical protein
VKLPRSYGSRIYVLHLLVVAAALVAIYLGQWRVGIFVIGAAFVAAAIARIFVPKNHTGMLRVRGKAFDVAWMGFLGVSLAILAVVVPG